MNVITNPWNIVFLAGFIAYTGIRGVYVRRTKHEPRMHRQIDGLEKFLLVVVIGGSVLLPVLYLFTPLLSFADYELPTLLPPCGAAIMLLALWLFWRSHADLGQNWSVSLELREEHQLVTHGVYRSIRHPMYAAIWLFGIAQALMLANWLAGCSSLVPFAVMYVLRVPREEQMMREFFGQAYVDYASRTGKMIPRLRTAKKD
jgi:protein-S-isoprenylcysteine O-methyltransferase Ste14